MQYVRGLSESVSTAWNSINPATLSGAIDVIVVEHDDGTLSCSPFHVRFGKFSLLRPSEKKVEFRLNGLKQEYSMKLGEGGEAFFVFETTEAIPQSLQTSPLVSPASSPPLAPDATVSDLQEPDQFDLNAERPRRPPPTVLHQQAGEHGMLTPASSSPRSLGRPASGDWSGAMIRPYSDTLLRHTARRPSRAQEDSSEDEEDANVSERSQSPPRLAPTEAIKRAMTLHKELSSADIPSKITENGDLMLDMTRFQNSEEDMIRAEVLARKILTEELDGNYDIGSLFGFDGEGNLWIYSSEEAKQAAIKSQLEDHIQDVAGDAASDPGYQSDGSDVTTSPPRYSHRRSESDAGPLDMQTPPRTPPGSKNSLKPTRNFAKTLRLTSDQLKELELKPGPNAMSFTVNRATCSANMFLWRHETPVVISDIDGTVTKSDALGHLYTMIGRDWTHTGIAKLYCDIVANGYNIMYLTSRSVGQADTTRAYLSNIAQEGYKMPAGPTILSPDRTMAALRREVYLRQPQVFKMATLRDIRNLFGPERSCFYAGFGNRLTDQMSYRTVDVPRNRIFTINTNSEVSLDLLSLNNLKMSYFNINEVVDHYFPPVSTLIQAEGEEFTDFKYWRNEPLPMDDFSASEDDDDDDDDQPADDGSNYAEDDEDEEVGDGLGDSYISRVSTEANLLPQKKAPKPVLDEQEDSDEDSEDEDEECDSEDDTQQTPERAVMPRTPELRHVQEDVVAELITGKTGVVKPAYVEEPVEIRPTPPQASRGRKDRVKEEFMMGR